MKAINNQSFASYRIRDLKDGRYQIHKMNGSAYEGSITQIFAVGIQWCLNEEDMIQAVMEMIELDHDYAEFGHFGRLIFTAKDQVQYVA